MLAFTGVGLGFKAALKGGEQIVEQGLKKAAAKKAAEEAAKKKFTQEEFEKLSEEFAKRGTANVTTQGLRAQLKERIIELVGNELKTGGGKVTDAFRNRVREWLISAGPRSKDIFVDVAREVFNGTKVPQARVLLDEMIHIASRVKF